MERQAVHQWQGLVALVGDAVVAAADAIETAHVDTAKTPYAVLQRIPLVRRPAGAIARLQFGITAAVYSCIRAVAAGSAYLAAQGLAAAERSTGEP